MRRTAALTLVSAACAIGLLELLVRLAFPAFDPSGQFDFTYRVGDRLVLVAPNTVARQRKNTGDFDVSVRINGRGLRDDKDVAGATPADIVVVGDSFAWGWGVEAEQRFSDQLQTTTGRRVFNVSTPTDIEGYAALLDHARDLGGRFNQVVLALCMENDLADYGASPAGRAESAPSPAWDVRPWLDSHSAAYLLFTTVVHQTPWMNDAAVGLGVIRPNLAGMSRNTYSASVVEASADRVADIGKRYRLLVVIIPSRALWVGDNRAVEDRVHQGFVGALQRRGLDVLDLRPRWEAGGHPLAYHFANDGHWNARGHQLAAEAIAERLMPR